MCSRCVVGFGGVGLSNKGSELFFLKQQLQAFLKLPDKVAVRQKQLKKWRLV